MKSRFNTAIAIAAALIAGAATTTPMPALAVPPECRQRAIEYCSDNWQYDGYATLNECIDDVADWECNGQPPSRQLLCTGGGYYPIDC
jgi:hypothetical protein